MNKNIKKIIAVTLTIGALGAVLPQTNLNLMTTTAYAADNKLTSLKLKTSSGSTIETYSDDDYKSKNEVDDNELEVDKIYYAKTNSSKIKVNTSGSSYVKVFKGTSSSTKGVDDDKSISLSSGSNTIIVRVYSEDPGSVKYSDTSKKISEYKIKVKCTSGSSKDDDDDDDDNNDDDVYLKSISLSDGDISFSKKTSTYDVKVGESVDEVNITAKPDCDSDDYDDYEVKIDGTTVDEDDKFKKSVSLDKGDNEIKIKVEDDDNNDRTYTLNIKRGTSSSTSSDDDDDKQDDVYLKDISLSDGDISFSKKTSTYDVKVGESVDEIKITAKPDCDSDDYDDYEVKIDGTTVDDDDKFKRTVSLDKGKNEIKIKVEDDDNNDRTYTLNVTRGTSTNTSNTSTADIKKENTSTAESNKPTNVITTAPKISQWVQSNGKWQYNDAIGNTIKKSWFYDKNYNKSYYLQDDGSMATGWLSYSGSWYYLGTDGGKKTGWQLVDGTWYYLKADGIMAYNTTIDGYRLASNGAWIR